MGVTRTNGIPGLPGNNNFKVLDAGAKPSSATRRSTPAAWRSTAQPRDGRGVLPADRLLLPGLQVGRQMVDALHRDPEGRGDRQSRGAPRTAMALKIEHDAAGKVTGVVYADKDGKQQRQKARVVCVAGNSIESPRLLLNCASTKFPDGLANSSGQVGRNYMRHMTGSVYAAFDKPVHMYRGTTMAGIIRDEAANNPKRGFVGGYEMETLSLGLPFMAAFLDPGAWGREFTSRAGRLREHGRHVAGRRGHAAGDQPHHARSRPPRTSAACRSRTCISTTIPTTSPCATTPTRQGSAVYEAVGATGPSRRRPIPAPTISAPTG